MIAYIDKIQFKRGSTDAHQSFVGADGEITIDTGRKTVRFHDGTTPGGFEVGTGARGNGLDKIFFENDQAVTTDYTITEGKNAMSVGPITIGDGVEVTIPDGSNWIIF
jgi:hypothetical protein